MARSKSIAAMNLPDDESTKAARPRSSKPPAAPAEDAPIIIPTPGHKVIRVGISAAAPLLVHNWDEKAKEMIRRKQFGQARLPKASKEPTADYEASLYRDAKNHDQYGVPVGAFKASMVDAGALIEPKMVKRLKVAFHILADGTDATSGMPIVHITGQPEMSEAFPRISMGTVDLRYRGIFHTWTALLTIRYMTLLITGEQVVNLVSLAGQTMGICEWRPSSPRSRTGTYGLWQVDESEETDA